jgi:hypothetical protein
MHQVTLGDGGPARASNHCPERLHAIRQEVPSRILAPLTTQIRGRSPHVPCDTTRRTVNDPPSAKSAATGAFLLVSHDVLKT